MALSGSFSGSIRSGNYKLRVDWSASQSVTNNTSKITCALYLVQASSWSLDISGRTGNTCTINGVEHTWSAPAISNGGGKTTKLATVTSGNISHNADGTKSVTISATYKIMATISGTYYDTITASATVALDTIPRATQPTLSATSVNMGSAVTINLPRASSSFTHDLAYKFAGSDWTTIKTGATTSHIWTVPDLASKIPNATSGTVTIRCTTKNGSTTIGTKTVLLTAKVPASVVPTVHSLALSETVSGLAAQFGAFVKSKSKIRGAVSAGANGGATIKSIVTTIDGTNYSGANWTASAAPSKAGTLSASVKVTDSRGRSASKSFSYTVLDYTAPTVTALSVARINAAGTDQSDGVYMRAAWSYKVASVGGKNTASMRLEYKRSIDTSWVSTPLATGTSLTESTKKAITSVTFSTDYQYDIRLTVSDWFGTSASYSAVLPSGEVILDLAADGLGLAFGKTSEQPGVEFGWPVVGQELSAANTSGRYRTHDGMLIQWGTVSITPSAANTATTAVVTFKQSYAATPCVLLTPISSVPDRIRCSVQRNADIIGAPSTEGVAVTLYRTDTTTTGINWVAFGQAGAAAARRALLVDAGGDILRDADGAYLMTEEE
jgi:hypothetical protein